MEFFLTLTNVMINEEHREKQCAQSGKKVDPAGRQLVTEERRCARRAFDPRDEQNDERNEIHQGKGAIDQDRSVVRFEQSAEEDVRVDR